MYMHIYIYIYVYIYRCRGPRATSSGSLGAKDSTPEINTSEIAVDCQWHFPIEFHLCGFWCVIFCPASRSWRSR